MFSLTRLILRAVEFAGRWLSNRRPQHLKLGRAGETEAYFYLRGLGYTILETNFRGPFHRGEIDLVASDHGVLCFVEVKTRSSADFAPPSTAVDQKKKRQILEAARHYLRRLPGAGRPSCRFDIVSVVAGEKGSNPKISLRKGAFSWDATRPKGHRPLEWGRNYNGRAFWRRR